MEEKTWDWVDVESLIEKRVYELQHDLIKPEDFTEQVRMDLQELMGEPT